MEDENQNTEIDDTAVDETPETPEVEESETENSEKSFTQKELDQIVQKRIERERAKYSEYVSPDDLNKKTEELQNENAGLLERAEKAEADLLRHQIASETGVPVALLKGATEEELREESAVLLEFKGTKPTSSSFEKVNDSKPKGSNADLFASAMESLR